MDKSLIQIILSHLPEAKITETGGMDGSYKIRLPHSLNQMPGYKELRKALKESGVKPRCSSCRSGNTKFRYFDNSFSKALQARYKCLSCDGSFTLGGKQYAKDLSNSHHDHHHNDHNDEASAVAARRKRLVNLEEDVDSDIQNKRLKWLHDRCSSNNNNVMRINYADHAIVETVQNQVCRAEDPVLVDFFQQIHNHHHQQQRQLLFHNQNSTQIRDPAQEDSALNISSDFDNVFQDHIELQLSTSRDL